MLSEFSSAAPTPRLLGLPLPEPCPFNRIGLEPMHAAQQSGSKMSDSNKIIAQRFVLTAKLFSDKIENVHRDHTNNIFSPHRRGFAGRVIPNPHRGLLHFSSCQKISRVM